MSTRLVRVLQGVPGSGKSTYAQQLVAKNPPCSVVVVSADDYFVKDGVYVFDPTKIGEAHATALRAFVMLIEQGRMAGALTVVVDNTNIRLWEMSPYVALAKAYGWPVEFDTFKVDPLLAHARNTHGVPLPVIQRMAAEMENPLPFWGGHVVHES